MAVPTRENASADGLPSGNYWSVENDADNAWILNSDGTSLNDNGNNDHKDNGNNQVLCVAP